MNDMNTNTTTTTNTTNTAANIATTTLVNLTPHSITLRGQGGSIPLPKGEALARVEMPKAPMPPLNVLGVKLPVRRACRGQVIGLPAPQPNTVFVASALVAGAANRPDVMSPGDLIRDDAGQPVAANGLVAYANPAPTPPPAPSAAEIAQTIDRLQQAAFADADTLDAWDDLEDPAETAVGRAYAWARLILDGHRKYPHANEAWWAIRAVNSGLAGCCFTDPANAQRLASLYIAIGTAYAANVPDDEETY